MCNPKKYYKKIDGKNVLNLHILSCFPWRVVNSVKGGMWHFFCTLHFAFCICIALHLHCFALRLLCKLPGSPGEVKNTGSHTATRSPSSSEQRRAVSISWFHRLRCVLGMGTWCINSSVGVSVDHSVFAPAGGRNALMPHSVWVGAYIVRRLVARKSFALMKLD